MRRCGGGSRASAAPTPGPFFAWRWRAGRRWRARGGRRRTARGGALPAQVDAPEPLRDPIELADLQVTGDDLRRAGIPAGPVYAKILHALLERVLEEPARNTAESLLAEVPAIVAALEGSGRSEAKPKSEL